MSKFDDYINALEGAENLDPLKIAKDLHSIYNEETGIREAKITELMGTVAERDSALTVAASDLQVQKAKNFDLAMQIPAGANTSNSQQSDQDADNAAEITVDDLFVK